MQTTSTKTSLLTLGVTSLLCSRATFYFFNDPEGPNLLIVVGLAAILYTLSLGVYIAMGRKSLLLAIIVQILLATALYFVGR